MVMITIIAPKTACQMLSVTKQKKTPVSRGLRNQNKPYGFTETLTVFASPPVVAVTTTVVAAAGFVVVTVNVA
jgi:hypothetical protein